MKSLITHCRNFKSEFDGFADRPQGIVPQELKEDKWQETEAVVAFITVEDRDRIKEVSQLMVEELYLIANEFGRKKVVLIPFAHLSSNIANYKDALSFLDYLEEGLKQKELDITRVHFGSHKSLLLDIPGHTGNIRFREF
ncbi:hypothetical protein KC866_01640 [Patescibacteria group bacterium]|nr:hypothetical protein [Patescibacteria group bacterium]